MIASSWPPATSGGWPRTSRRRPGLRAGEVAEGPRRRRAALVLVAGAVDRGAVGVLGRRGEPEQAQLADLHAGPERDRQVRHVRQLQRDVSGEAGVDEPGG